MNKYKVKVTHLFAEVFDIDAADKEDAKQKVVEFIQKEDFQGKPQYETTLPSEHWAVVTEEEFQEMVKNFQEGMANQQEANKEESNIIIP